MEIKINSAGQLIRTNPSTGDIVKTQSGFGIIEGVLPDSYLIFTKDGTKELRLTKMIFVNISELNETQKGTVIGLFQQYIKHRDAVELPY